LLAAIANHDFKFSSFTATAIVLTGGFLVNHNVSDAQGEEKFTIPKLLE
jgi:hypothetical protein